MLEFKLLFVLIFSLNLFNTIFAGLVPGHKVCLSKACVLEAAKLLNTIDQSVSPCDDFYQFSCGNWIKNKKLPEHKSVTNRFGELQDDLNDKLNDLILKTDFESEQLEFIRNAKKYYDSCVNTTRLEELGDKPLRDTLDQLGGWPLTLATEWTEQKWIDIYDRLKEKGLVSSIFFTISISPDFKNNTRRILSIDQPSFGLGSRDAVLKGVNDTSVKAYRNLMIKAALKLGADPNTVESSVDDIFEFETILAKNTMAKELRRNITSIYNKLTIKELTSLAPNIDWLRIIKKFVSNDLTEDEEIILFDTQYVKYLNDILPKYSNRFLANIILWRVIEGELSGLNEEWYLLKEEFEKAVYGTKSRAPRWETCLKNTKSSLSIALSHLYVKNFFSDDDKEKALEMFENVVNEFRRSLTVNKWMNGDTLEEAMNKLNNIKLLVGYPPELMDELKIAKYYETLKIDSSDYFGNNVRLSQWYTELAFSKLREPVDHYDWRDLSGVAVVNAYYHSLKNLVVMPAGILQGVFFNKDRPNYLNYGSIAYVSGHEIIHGFDDGGRQYDSKGNLRNWWDRQTDQIYSEKARCFIDQYTNMTVKEIGQHLNGINTQGENIADNGGALQSYRAYLDWAKKNGEEPQLPALDYTPEQLFWISSAVQYCAKATNEYLKIQVMTDSHSPPRQRVNAVVSNAIEFSNAFNCPLGSPMNPNYKCNIW